MRMRESSRNYFNHSIDSCLHFPYSVVLLAHSFFSINRITALYTVLCPRQHTLQSSGPGLFTCLETTMRILVQVLHAQ